MKSVEAIRAAVRRRWDEGTEHRAYVLGDSFELLEIPLNPPMGRRLAEQFAQVRDWTASISDFVQQHDLEVEYQIIANQKIGRQRVPQRLVIDRRDAFLSVIAMRRDYAVFAALCDEVLPRVPALRDLFASQPHRVMSFVDRWPSILRVVDYVAHHDVSGRYLRELDLEGVDTKFIDMHKGILDEVLRAALPAQRVHDTHTGLSGHAFEKRYGFRFDQPLVRFRWLGESGANGPYDDLSVPLDQFAATPIDAATVFIVENKMNLLSFPDVPDAVAIFGQGYAVTRLAQAAWLADRDLVYFGDIDTHGFSILDRLRKTFPGARSMLMDRATLLAHRHAWVEEPATKRQLYDLTRLDDQEHELFDDLRHDRLGRAVRLEQERVRFSRVVTVALALAGSRG